MSESSPVRSLPDPESTLDSADRALRTERRRLVDERGAFEEFRSRLRSVPASEPRDRKRLPVDRTRGTGVERVREAYRATVMSVPGYREDYGDSLRESVAAEFSEELAASLVSGAELYPHLKEALLAAAREAAEVREAVIDLVDRERKALEWKTAQLREVHEELRTLLDQPLERAEFNTLRRTRERLVDLRERCEDLAEDRRELLGDHVRTCPVDVEDVGRYLYGDCEAVHPVLSQLAALTAAIEAALTRTDRLLATAA